MILLERLGSDQDRANFLSGLVTKSRNGFAGCQIKIVHCDPVGAYFMFVSICNELGVSVNEGAMVLEAKVKSASRKGKVVA